MNLSSRQADDGSLFLFLILQGIGDDQILDPICCFLGLEPDKLQARPLKPVKTAFIAHRFDAAGIAAADKIARFLELLGFQVVTGRGYTPGPVSDKVRTLLEQQALVFVALTPVMTRHGLSKNRFWPMSLASHSS